MTNKEAIKILSNATFSEEWQGNEELTTAYLMAIEALKTQLNCEECFYKTEFMEKLNNGEPI